MELELTVRCGCGRTMAPDVIGPQRYRCGCGARVQLLGVPAYRPGRCSLLRGTRICNGAKLHDDPTCEPCAVLISTLALARPETAEQLGTKRGATEYHRARKAEIERLVEERDELARVDRRPNVTLPCVVYYCELRPNVVKIGTTSQLAARMKGLRVPPAALLAAEPGHYELEKQRHRQFASQRIAQREDFVVNDALRTHIASVAAEHGDPFDLVARMRRDLQGLAPDGTQS